MRELSKGKFLLVFFLDAAVIFAIIFYKDIANALKLLPVCPMYALGLRCAACGGTRCICALMRFDIAGALKFNFPIVLFAIYTAVVLPLANICLFTKNRALNKVFGKLCCGKVAVIWAVSFAAYMLIRNIALIFGFEF